ncbi:MAG: 50S ribosomal protein L17 [Actinomycetaceae bacterium]|nr:50S ribosomal protein L17 [Actinomycetaceae bacterium]MDY6082859.1 50S ribosomal protein L17 [Actinomycetaceae bacterium]
MPKPKKGPRLGGSAARQRRIIDNLCKQLIRERSIRTTQAKAKTVQPYIEKMITKAKKGGTFNRRLVLRHLRDRESAYILFEELAPLFAGRDGGYTRIVKVGNRKGDNAPMAVISLVTEKVAAPKKQEPQASVSDTEADGAADAKAESTESSEATEEAASEEEVEETVEA